MDRKTEPKKRRLTCCREMFLFMIMAVIINKTIGKDTALTCPPGVLLHLHKEDRIKCNINVDFTKIYWYNQTSRDTLIYFIKDDPKERGPNSALDEFDITDDGSLVIRNVTLSHEIKYSVMIVWNEAGTKETHEIVHVEALVIVPSSEQFPIIDTCETSDCRLCVPLNDREMYPLRCWMTGKPLTLEWYNRTSSSVLENQTPINSSVPPFNNSVETVLHMRANDITELICTSSGKAVPSMSANTSVLVIGESVGDAFQKVYFEQKKDRHLGNKTNNEGTWIKQTEKTGCRVIGNSTDGRFTISSGQLVIHDFTEGDEGIYSFVAKHGEKYKREIYHVKLAHLPDFNKSYINRCNNRINCVKDKAPRRGYVTCQYNGLRPLATIEWKLCEDNTGVTFQEGVIPPPSKSDEDIYNASQTVHYHFSRRSSCHVSCNVRIEQFKITHTSSLTLTFVGDDEL